MRRIFDRLATTTCNALSIRSTGLAALSALPLAVILAACGVAADSGSGAEVADEGDPAGEHLGRGREEIINGTTIPAPDSGVVVVYGTGGCTGTLLTNDWILTAAHCLSSGNLGSPSTINVVYGAQQKTADWAAPHPSVASGVDVALIHVSSPFAHKGLTSGYSRGIYAGSTASLVGKQLTCMGYGANAFDQSGWGTLRLGLISVGGAEGPGYRVNANAQGQIQWHGDSGGSCMLDVQGGRLITGVQSSSTYSDASQTVVSAWQPSAEYFRTWVLNTITATLRIADPFESPLANNAYRVSIWDPCNGGCANWTASYDFETGYDTGHFGSASLTGNGTSSGSVCGQISITAITDSSVQSPGFSAISATCQSSLQCFGPECFTAPAALPDNSKLSAVWNPCFGACYTWTAQYNMENGYDHFIVDGHSYTGAGTATGSSCGMVTVKADTDGSVQSAGARLTATCPAPSGPCHTGNTCGGYSSSGACWCDQGCMAYGDCCSDGPC
jgi:hypothetical protein